VAAGANLSILLQIAPRYVYIHSVYTHNGGLHMSTQPLSPRYGGRLFRVEPYGIERVADADRHGSARSQFSLWLGSNLTIADFALGALPIALGMPWSYTIAAILFGNLLGGLVLGLCAAMGPVYGVPQLMIGRHTFGRIGGYLPAALNYFSTIGWFAVNNILGTFGLRILFPRLSFWEGALLLVVLQGLLAIYGHNLIHAYERIMSVVLGGLFAVVSVIVVMRHGALAAYHPAAAPEWPLFLIMVSAAFSYIGSWGPYASDYSRYLNKATPRRQIIGYSFWGAFLASVWLECLGAAVTVLAGAAGNNSIVALHDVTGDFGTIAVIAIILGGTAADALNLYSNALSAGAFDIRVPRWGLALFAAVLGLFLSLLGAGAFEQNYENFLLLLGYWITPWMGVLFADFYMRGRSPSPGHEARARQGVYLPGLISFLVGFGLSTPFMSSTWYTGFIAKALGGVDLTFAVGFLVALITYLLWTHSSARSASA